MTDQHQDLVAALVDEKHRDAYLQDAFFRLSIDTLASMLPAWVQGIAAETAHRQADVTAWAAGVPNRFDAGGITEPHGVGGGGR